MRNTREQHLADAEMWLGRAEHYAWGDGGSTEVGKALSNIALTHVMLAAQIPASEKKAEEPTRGTTQYIVEARDLHLGSAYYSEPETEPKDVAAVAALLQMKGYEISVIKLLSEGELDKLGHAGEGDSDEPGK